MSLLQRRIVLLSASIAAPSFLLVALIFLALHSVLFLYDLDHPASFLVGDRAVTRLIKIEAFSAALTNPPDVAAVLQTFGNPGDYAIHALLFSVAGQYGIILAQIALELFSLLFLYWLADRIFHSAWLSFVTVVSYLLLPGSIEFPHLLVTEALFNPLLIISIYYVVCYFQGERKSAKELVVAGLLLSIAVSIRIVALPLTVVVIVLILSKQGSIGERIGHGIVYAAAALLLPAIIVLFYYSVAGTPSMGDSDHSLPRNLADRVQRVAEVGQIDLAADLGEARELGIGEFIGFVAQHPKPYLKTVAGDVVNITANSGVNHLLGRYLHFFELEKESTHYTEVRDQSGYLGLLRVMLTDSPLMLAVNLISVLAWAGFGLVVLYGGWLFVNTSALDIRIRILLPVLVVYMVAVSQLVGSVSYRHRTPIEFVLALLFALGGSQLWWWHAGRHLGDGKARTVL
jgi:hypothetical protein